jgi:hypothetical protein
MSSSTQHAPVQSFRLNNVSLGIFENEATIDGNTRTFLSAKVERSYRDRETGKWNTSSPFSVDELLRLQHLIGRAVEFMAARPNNDADRSNDQAHSSRPNKPR